MCTGRHRLAALLAACAVAAAPTSEDVNFDLALYTELLPLELLPVLSGTMDIRAAPSTFDKDALTFVQAALRAAVPGLADSPQWSKLYGKYGANTRKAVARFEREILGLPESDGGSITGETLRQLLQFQPELLKAARSQTPYPTGKSNPSPGNRRSDKQLKADWELMPLRKEAMAAEKARKSEDALALWRRVLQLAPTDYQASRAIGMALSYKDKFSEAMPYLKTALGVKPTDYTLNHYAGINQKLRADRLPETDLPLKRKLWKEAIGNCETARGSFPKRKPGVAPSWSDRFFFIHCCEPYESLGLQPGPKRTCNDEAMAKGIWKTPVSTQTLTPPTTTRFAGMISERLLVLTGAAPWAVRSNAQGAALVGGGAARAVGGAREASQAELEDDPEGGSADPQGGAGRRAECNRRCCRVRVCA